MELTKVFKKLQQWVVLTSTWSTFVSRLFRRITADSTWQKVECGIAWIRDADRLLSGMFSKFAHQLRIGVRGDDVKFLFRVSRKNVAQGIQESFGTLQKMQVQAHGANNASLLSSRWMDSGIR